MMGRYDARSVQMFEATHKLCYKFVRTKQCIQKTSK